jgi:hypothetical protein
MALTPIWSQEDVDKLRAAVLALASGEAVQTVTYSGPPSRTVMYQVQDLDKMRALLSEMVADVRNAAGTRRGYRVATTRKGM